MKIYLIRHGKTAGNLLGKYVGRQTDESLCDEGIEELMASKKLLEFINDLPKDIMIFSGGMKRCYETAKLLFPKHNYILLENMTEIDFGALEYKNYLELGGNIEYQNWLSSGGKTSFPSRESQEDFIERSYKEFKVAAMAMLKEECDKAILFCHGGNIMSIMSRLTGQDYYAFQVKNGSVIQIEFDIRGENIDYISHNLI